MMHRRAVLAAGLALPVLGAVANTASRPDAIVVGAGLAGLYAARQLEAGGMRVQVLEAGAEPGGRLRTIERGGLRFDVGAVEVAMAYSTLRAEAEVLGVALEEPSKQRSLGGAIAYADSVIEQSQWPAHPYAPAGGQLPPAAWLSTWLSQATPLARSADWRDPAQLSADQSVYQLLRDQGIAPELIRLAEVSANYNDLHLASALDVRRRDALRREAVAAGGVLRIAGGSQTLPQRMAQSLQTPTRYNTAVVAIAKAGARYRITLRDGSTLESGHVVLAIPTSAVASIRFEPALPDTLQPLLQQRSYTQVLTVNLRPTRAFWEQDGLPPTMWVDGPLERVFAIQSGAQVERLLVWINGRAAVALMALRDADISRYVMLELQRLRPASAGALEFLAVQRWGGNRDAGAYVEGQVGEMPKLAAALDAYPELCPPRLAMAGEHMQFNAAGMEAAMQSGAAAAARFLTRS